MSELPQIKCELNMLSNDIIIRLPLITLNHVCTDMTGYELDYEKLIDRILNDNDPDTGRTRLQQYIEDTIERLAGDGELEELMNPPSA